MSRSRPFTIVSSSKHTSTLIFMHGFRDNARKWGNPLLGVRTTNMKIICPEAPKIPVKIMGGLHVLSWFDIKSFDAKAQQDEEGIQQAAKYIHEIISNEIAIGIKPYNIFLCGFSQGGALALYVALTYPEKIGGVIGLSCWLPLHQTFPTNKKCPNTVPVLLCHGDKDPIIKYDWAKKTAKVLKSMLNDVILITYHGLDHTYIEEELQDIKKFIATNITKLTMPEK